MAGQVRVDEITDEAGTGSPSFPNGLETTTLNELAYPDASSMGFRNRIINGDMRIDQRNNGAAVTVNGGGDFFVVDRWPASGESADGVFTGQRSTVVPAGFTNSLVCTVTTADASIGATQRYFVEQKIEGFNFADLGFGSAAAQSVTLSFWVRSSVTGTFGGALTNVGSRFYPFSYTISAANTWEQKSVTIAGDTTGTWVTGNTAGAGVVFSLGCGSSRKGAANTWSGSAVFAPTGSVDLIATSGATFYITGVQLEAGSVATPFERRPYTTELQLCQRYYEKSYNIDVVPGTSTADGIVMVPTYYSNARLIATSVPLMVPKRIGNWTLTYWDRVGNLTRTSEYSSATWTDNLTSSGTFLVSQGERGFLVYPSNANDTGGFHFTASAEL